METREQVQDVNRKLLMEIIDLRSQLEDLYIQTGPNSSKYVNISLQLYALEKEYITNKINLFVETNMQLIPVLI